MDWMIVSQVFLWLLVLSLTVVCFALTRQVGVLFERVAPAGALAMNANLSSGDKAPALSVETLDGATLDIGSPELSGEKSQLLFFLSPDCPVCKTLLVPLISIAKREEAWLDVVLASDGDTEKVHRRFINDYKLTAFPYIVSELLGRTYGISKLPYGVLIDEKGVLVSLGIVNSREHIESLIEAKLTGIADIQSYLELNENTLKEAQS